MTGVHGVGAPYATLVDVLSKNQAELEKQARTAWLPMPDELDRAISAIEAMDERGVFFRYPTDRNVAKSVKKPITAEELTGWDRDQRSALRALVTLNQEDEIVET
ncbi:MULTISPECIES: hypothetical protein [unclassified Rhizobium]|uniref:hypothetical protein n=1 Tax=unclassified Rhizobium TaxID=2613769 RepID=UPI001045A97F|nr:MULTISPECIES: hypothetical protein [unclassified Rhizobium]MBB3398852.1 hypothetical protein [Rhizobium sp. BK060]MBB4171458.1 hypothetical protein [Rhizobium sp. BK538]TCM68232.1 hypothetical protein EV291_1303 [Rhizobium sp. BK068]